MEEQPPSTLDIDTSASLGVFERYLSVWIALSMVIGAVIGVYCPSVVSGISRATIASVNIPIGVLVFFMIFPLTLRIDFHSLLHIMKHPRSLLITVVCNWAIQPFLMFGLALLFFRVVYASVLNKSTQDQVRGETKGKRHTR